MPIQLRNKLLVGSFLALLGGIAGAADSLEKRILQYWHARQLNDIHTVYHMESAALPKGWLTPDKYRLVMGLPVRDVKIVDIRIDGESAEVKLEGKVEVGTLGWASQTLVDQWVQSEGKWYHRSPDNAPAR